MGSATWIAVLTCVMTILGVEMSVNTELVRRWIWVFRISFVLMGIGVVWFTHIQDRDNGNQVSGLQQSLDHMNKTLASDEAGRREDNAYLKAKLEDAYSINDQMRAFAPAIMKMAQTQTDITKKEYERKITTDKDLRDFTNGVIKRLRDLQNEYNTVSRQQEDAMFLKNASAPRPKTTDEMLKQGAAEQQAERELYTQLRYQYEQIYRSTIMGDAQYARRELLIRVGGDSDLLPMERSKSIAIDGILAGPSPIGNAADYLDALLRKLSP